MAIYKKLDGIKRLNGASLTSIVDITNLNFKSLSEANLEFLGNISYDEIKNSIKLSKGSFNTLEISTSFSMLLGGVPTLTIDSLGRLEGQEILTKVAETKRLRLSDFTDWPEVGVPGEIIYTGIQNQKPEFGEDFIGYLDSKGWVSLTGGKDLPYVILTELTGSPFIYPTPNPGQGILWIGQPGLQTSTVPTTQTVYYTDENDQTFDVLSGQSGSSNDPTMVGFNETPDGIISQFTAGVKQNTEIVFYNGMMQLKGTSGDYTAVQVGSLMEITFSFIPGPTDQVNIYGIPS